MVIASHFFHVTIGSRLHVLVFLSPWIPPFRVTFLPQATLESDEKESDAFSLTRNVQFARIFGSGRKKITDTQLAASWNIWNIYIYISPLPQFTNK